MILFEDPGYPQARFILDGREYRWSGDLGCQLESLERTPPPAGTTRTLYFGIGKDPIDVTVYSTKREGIRKYRATWAVSKSGTHDEHVTRIEKLRDSLRKLI